MDWESITYHTRCLWVMGPEKLVTAIDEQDFSLSFLIYLVITFLVYLYQTTGKNAAKSAEQREGGVESGYSSLSQRDGPEVFELQEHEHDEMTLGSGSGDDDATKIGGEDEIDWMRREGSRVRI